MKSDILNAIMKRYGGLTNLYSAMQDCLDTVLVNLVDDLEDKYTEDFILNEIYKSY